MGTSCTIRERLAQKQAELDAKLDAARRTLEARIGTCSKAEYLELSQEVNALWRDLSEARGALDAHIRAHKCFSRLGAGTKA